MKAHLPPKTERLKVMVRAVWTLQIFLLLSGCAAIQIAGEVDRGRRAYLEGHPDVALNDFLRAAEQDPGYRYINSILSQGVWTYVGRAYYETGKYSQARRALEKAHSLHKDDYLADLYLGLALAKEDQRQRGLQEIHAGLTGLRSWLDWVQQYDPEGWLWDPSGDLRREIDKDLAMISRREFSWNELISSGEWLGKKFEEEIDLVRRDQFNMEQRDSDDNRDN
jgi:tetratricopeptide (TPR) repeat protein